MTGLYGIMAVVLAQTAVGGAVVLWGTGVWGVVRRGFLLLVGVTLTVSAAAAWGIVSAATGAEAGPAVTMLGGFTVLLAVWQVLTFARLETAARVAGLAAAAVGVASLVPLAGLSPHPLPFALAEVGLGALFLGSATFGLLLGHWYLVERRLSPSYMVRGANWYAAGVLAGIGAVVLSARNPAPPVAGFSPVLAVPGFSVMLAAGLVAVCALIAAFTWKLAREGGRSIQAATGMFYLAVIMAFSAELAAKFRFF